MKKILIVLAALSVAALGGVSPAMAAPYLSVNSGSTWTKDSDLSVQGFDSPGEHSYDMGYALNLAVGNSYSNGVRPEVEICYRFNDIDEFSMENLEPIEFDREISFLALMTNAYYDFLDSGSALRPFVGAGIGYGLMQIEGWHVHHDAGVFAYQLMAGCGYALTPKVTIDLQYRFFATEDPEFNTREPTVGKITIESEYQTQSLMLGLRYHF